MEEKALKYHAEPVPGKISVLPTKLCTSAEELSLAYTPGVAKPCLEIEKNQEEAYRYTAKGNLVAVISNGSAVLGLGNIGALAGKPVMEGKSVLFKRFADVDVFDLEINEQDPKKMVEIVSSLEPTFGGINLEDIKAPECFYIEEELIKRMKIPVFHDDQHGTAVISGAGLLNALEIAGKNIEEVKVIFVGAGAAGIAIANLLIDLGLNIKNIFMFDSKGLITKERDVNKYKAKFAQEEKLSLEEALKGADVFIGVSKAGLLTKEMVRSMAKKPIVFAMANPDPEITYDDGKSAVPDIILATGRSDYPNQVNNVLGFPFIFRGALDVRATSITKNMKLAAVRSLAKLAHEPVPKEVNEVYGKEFIFGPDYIIPKPFDPRVLYHVAPAVAKAAMECGVAKRPIMDFDSYISGLKKTAERLASGNFCVK
ncbi:MAG: malic enzyme-like NAD(P)-binding protein [Nanoarchaeota archaeon]|nr:malate dehydrogenase [Nanoarchaeota archaeon]MBU1632490.1 malate dehydrogenase [Nanoarchaeota archaeon]MBU1876646.1 malate dehydrogenase [Nanoarchaeota archaeon]